MKIDKFDIKPHEFKHPIEIQRAETVVNKDNIPSKNDWNKLFSTRAKILTNKSDEEKMMNGTAGITIKTFYIRASRKFKVSKNDRLIYNGEIYNIKSAEDVQEQGIYIAIKGECIQ